MKIFLVLSFAIFNFEIAYAVDCKEDVENSSSLGQRILSCQTLTEALLGDEVNCLRRSGAMKKLLQPNPAGESLTSPTNCIFYKGNPYGILGQITCASHAQARDQAVNAFFQDVAARSVSQIRLDLRLMTTLSVSRELRTGDRRQNTDDGDHHQQLD